MISRAVKAPERFRFVPLANYFLNKWMDVNFFFHNQCSGDDHTACYQRCYPIGTIVRLAKQDRTCLRHLECHLSLCISPGRDQLCPNFVRQCLRDCEEFHGSRCNGVAQPRDSETVTDYILVDTAKSRLTKVKSGQRCRYTALSYVWGQIRMLQTTKANYASLQRDGALDEAREEIPAVIRDAMRLTNTLGIRYLWVDCLCIVQDDGASKHIQLAQMDKIYRQAHLTIAAVSGLDANSPLPGVRPGGRPIVTDEAGGLYLAIYQPTLTSGLGRSRYGSRGWTLQESILSRRVLYVCDYQVYFRCNRGMESEVARVEYLDGCRAQTPLSILEPVLEEGGEPVSWGTVVEAYAEVVNIYMQRELSYPEDILNAFAGFASYFDRLSGGSSIYGLPEPFFNMALLWAARGEIVRRETPIHEANENRVQAPSWSWAGWKGEVFNDMAKMSRIPLRLWSQIDEFRVAYQDTERCIKTMSDINTHYLYEGPMSDSGRSEDRSNEATSANDALCGSLPAGESEFYRLPTLIFSTFSVGIADFRFQIRRVATVPEDVNYHLSRMNAKDYDYHAKILGMQGRHCGMFVGDIEHLPYGSEESTDFWHEEEWKWDFVFMSRIEKTPRRDFNVWLSYFNYFDEEIFGPEKDWDCVNVLLVKWEGEYAERFAAARIHFDAFRDAGPLKKSIRLI